MICAYLDESGNTGLDLSDQQQPLHSVSALLVPEKAWAGVKHSVADVVALARDCGLETGNFGELHGKEILHGSRGWRGVSMTNSLKILSECISIIEAHNLQLVGGRCDKRLLAGRDNKSIHPHSIALSLCLERVGIYAKQRNELAVLVADDCSPQHKKISLDTLRNCRESGASYGRAVDLSAVIDVIHFMPSQDSPHIQLCDVVMYIQHRDEQNGDARVRDLASRCRQLYVDVGVIP